jgi:hypothetical protein
MINGNIASSLIGALGIVSASASLFWPDIKTVSVWYLNVLLLLSSWAFILFTLKYSSLKEKNKYLKNENSTLAIKPYEIPFAIESIEEKTILIIRDIKIFSNQTFVGIYHKELGYEHLAFIGQIINHQTDGMFQIEITHQMPTNKIDLSKDILHRIS